jgi:hypothetical protein
MGVGGDHKPYKHETDVGSRQEFAFARKLDATWVGKNQILAHTIDPDQPALYTCLIDDFNPSQNV